MTIGPVQLLVVGFQGEREFTGEILAELHRLREHDIVRLAVLFLVLLAFMPGINNLGQVVVIVLLAVLAVVGIEVLRRQTAREFSPRPNSS